MAKNPHRAALQLTAEPTKFYFFSGETYILAGYKPGTLTDELIKGPAKIIDDWPALRECGFATIDCAWPNPYNEVQTWFFSGEQCALVNTLEQGRDFVVNPPRPIGEYWPGLQKIGFTTVDAWAPVPGRPSHVYFFKGNQYTHFVVDDQDTVAANNNTAWPTLTKSGFASVDTILPLPSDEQQAYYFSGPKYSRIKLDTSLTETLQGGPTNINGSWNSLTQAQFY